MKFNKKQFVKKKNKFLNYFEKMSINFEVKFYTLSQQSRCSQDMRNELSLTRLIRGKLE